ncbi:MAG: glycosyltransferase [Sulfitobacter sp.]
MSRSTHVLHLIDDTTAGGVTRAVTHIATSDHIAACVTQDVMSIQRGHFGKVPKFADIIVSHTAISWRTLPALIALRAARPDTVLVHVEHSYTEGFVTHNVKHIRRFTSLLKTAFSLFDQVVCVSHAQAAWMRRHKLCPRANLITIPSCVDLAPFLALPRQRGPVRTFGAIGRLDHQKGFDRLITAFRQLPDRDLRLSIYGEGPEKKALQTLAGSDPRIRLEGHAADPANAYASVDAVIMPSRWEAFGLVAIEALAAGRHLLCASVDGLKDHASSGAQYISGPSLDHLVTALKDIGSPPAGNLNAPPKRPCNTASLELWSQLIASPETPRKSLPSFLPAKR